jgi:hypothetical protein
LESSDQNAMMQALVAIDPADRTDRTVMMDGVEVRMRYAPEPGVELRSQAMDAGEPVAGTEFVAYEAASGRPASYPPELPYVPGLKVSLWQSPDGASASITWFNVADAESALTDLLAQCAASGWVQVAGPGFPPIPGMRMIHLQRGDVPRMINVVSMGDTAMISLLHNMD